MRVAWVALLAVVFTGPAHSRERYTNEKYGLSLAIPPGVDVCRSPAPQPNHGILFRPRGIGSPPCTDDIEAGARYTSADAHFAADAAVTPADFLNVECPQLAYDSQGKVTRIAPRIRPAGRRWAACRIDGMDGSIQEVLFTRRREMPGSTAIDYTLVLKTTARDYIVDQAAFTRWLTTVRLSRPR